MALMTGTEADASEDCWNLEVSSHVPESCVSRAGVVHVNSGVAVEVMMACGPIPALNI